VTIHTAMVAMKTQHQWRDRQYHQN